MTVGCGPRPAATYISPFIRPPPLVNASSSIDAGAAVSPRAGSIATGSYPCAAALVPASREMPASATHLIILKQFTLRLRSEERTDGWAGTRRDGRYVRGPHS